MPLDHGSGSPKADGPADRDRLRSGFSGEVSVQTLPDVVQLYALSGATGALEVRARDAWGEIWFDHGAITHAATSDGASGEAAFFALMGFTGGEFALRPGATSATRTIHAGCTELLMEGCRRDDERARAEPVAPEDARPTGWTHAPPRSEGPPPEPFDFDLAAALATPGAPRAIELPPADDLDPDEPRPSGRTDQERTRMNIKDSLNKLNVIDGFIGAALVDSESGMLLGHEGGGPLNLEVAAAGNTEVVRAKRKTMNSLNLKGEGIEDILISLSKQYHLIRPLRSRPSVFFYVALDRQRANLAMARLSLADVEKELQV